MCETEGPACHGYETVHRFVTDERFARLRKKADRGILLWSDMTEDDVPEGFTRDQTWSLLQIVRRQTGIELPWDTFMKKDRIGKGWYSNSRALTDALLGFNAKLEDESLLASALMQHVSSISLVRYSRQDFSAALRLSGLDIVSMTESGHPLAADEMQQQAADTLLRNFNCVCADLKSLAQRPITPILLEDCFYRIVEGVRYEPGEPPYQVAMHPDSIYRNTDTTVRTIAEILEGDTITVPMHPFLRTIYAQWMFWVARPFPAWNAVVEVLARQLCLMRFSYCAAALVPLAHLQLNWVEGEALVNRAYAELMSNLDRYYDDFTPFLLSNLQLVARDMDTLENLVERLQERNAELDELLADAHFNHRQRAIIANAIANPTVPQKIESHRQLHHVAYATARADFLNLARDGYLRQTSLGSAFAFFPGPKLESEI